MSKLNCWEFKKCGMEQGGSNTSDLRACPASINNSLDGIHGGRNAGRACWVITDTTCGGRLHGTFAQKQKECGSCDFYKAVLEEEGAAFEMTINLLRLVQQ